MRTNDEKPLLPACSDYEFRTEKIFIGNLPPTATRALLQKHFSTYGPITDCVIMVNKEGCGRGFGFCEYEDARSVDLALESWAHHYISGQWVEVKRASPENALRKYAKTRKVMNHTFGESEPHYGAVSFVRDLSSFGTDRSYPAARGRSPANYLSRPKSRVLAEKLITFVGFAISNVLFLEKLYPPEYFRRARVLGAHGFALAHDGVSEYLARVMASLKEAVQRQLLESIVLCILEEQDASSCASRTMSNINTSSAPNRHSFECTSSVCFKFEDIWRSVRVGQELLKSHLSASRHGGVSHVKGNEDFQAVFHSEKSLLLQSIQSSLAALEVALSLDPPPNDFFSLRTPKKKIRLIRRSTSPTQTDGAQSVSSSPPEQSGAFPSLHPLSRHGEGKRIPVENNSTKTGGVSAAQTSSTPCRKTRAARCFQLCATVWDGLDMKGGGSSEYLGFAGWRGCMYTTDDGSSRYENDQIAAARAKLELNWLAFADIVQGQAGAGSRRSNTKLLSTIRGGGVAPKDFVGVPLMQIYIAKSQ